MASTHRHRRLWQPGDGSERFRPLPPAAARGSGRDGGLLRRLPRASIAAEHLGRRPQGAALLVPAGRPPAHAGAERPAAPQGDRAMSADPGSADFRSADFGPPPAQTFDVVPSADEVASFRENGFLAVERLTTDAEIAWLREIFEFIFDPANAAARGAPVDRSGAHGGGPESWLGQAFFPEMQFPAILASTFHRNAKRYAAALLGVE